MMFISVDLPEPDGAHDRDELAAFAISRLTPRSATTSASVPAE